MILGCSVKPPVGWICTLNVEAANGKPYNLCFNFETDFDESGRVLPGVTGQRVPVQSLEDLHARVNLDADSFVNLKAYILKLKKRYEQNAGQCSQYGGN
jgi:hypothetical protein